MRTTKIQDTDDVKNLRVLSVQEERWRSGRHPFNWHDTTQQVYTQYAIPSRLLSINWHDTTQQAHTVRDPFEIAFQAESCICWGIIDTSFCIAIEQERWKMWRHSNDMILNKITAHDPSEIPSKPNPVFVKELVMYAYVYPINTCLMFHTINLHSSVLSRR